MQKTLLLTGGNAGIGYFMVRQWLEDGGRTAVLDLADEGKKPVMCVN